MILTEFCENSKVAFSDFSIMKNIVALSSSSFPPKIVCWLRSGFSNSICFLKSIAISLKCLKSICNLINYQFCSPWGKNKLVKSVSFLPASIKSINPKQKYPRITELCDCIRKMLAFMVFFLTNSLLSSGTCPTPKLS